MAGAVGEAPADLGEEPVGVGGLGRARRLAQPVPRVPLRDREPPAHERRRRPDPGEVAAAGQVTGIAGAQAQVDQVEGGVRQAGGEAGLRTPYRRRTGLAETPEGRRMPGEGGVVAELDREGTGQACTLARSLGRALRASASRSSGWRKRSGPAGARSGAMTSMPRSSSRRSAGSISPSHTCTRTSVSTGSPSSAAARATRPTSAGSPARGSTRRPATCAGSAAPARSPRAVTSSVSQNGLPPVRVSIVRTVSGGGVPPRCASISSAVSRASNGVRCARTTDGAPPSRRSVRAAAGANAASCGGRLVTSSSAGRAVVAASSPMSVRLAGSRSCRSSTTRTPQRPSSRVRTTSTAARSIAAGASRVPAPGAGERCASSGEPRRRAGAR